MRPRYPANTARRPKIAVSDDGQGIVSQAGPPPVPRGGQDPATLGGVAGSRGLPPLTADLRGGLGVTAPLVTHADLADLRESEQPARRAAAVASAGGARLIRPYPQAGRPGCA